MSRSMLIPNSPPKGLAQMIKFAEFLNALTIFKTTKDESPLIEFAPRLQKSSLAFLRLWIINQKLAWNEKPSDEFTVSPPWVADEGKMTIAELKETVKYKQAVESYKEFPLVGVYDFDKFEKNLSKKDWHTFRGDVYYGRLF